MPDTLQIDTPASPQERRGRSWIAWMGAATIAIALAVVMWPGSDRRTGSPRHEAHLPFGAAEQAYAANLRVDNLAMSRAENFLNQEVTTLAGQISNSGNASLANVEITVEFSDQLGQIVLRESRALFPAQAPGLASGERRDFEVSFEHIPPSWNVQKPAVRVSGIQFSPQQ